MTIEDFTECVASQILDYLPDKFGEANVTTYSTIKNSKRVHGLCIRLEGQCVAPVFYMENYYHENIEVITDELLFELAADIIPFYDDYFEEGCFSEVEKQIVDFNVDNFEEIKQYLKPILVNRNNYSELLTSFNYRVINDMAVLVIIDIPTEKFKYGPCCIKVSKDFEKLWNKSFFEIYEAAISNVSNEDFVLRDLGRRLMGKKEINYLEKDMIRSKKSLFELTGSDMVYGASAIINNKVMSKVCDLFPEGFYIIPSSIHECLIVSMKAADSPYFLRKQLVSINNDGSLISSDDILSYDIYTYEQEYEELVVV